MMASGTSGNPYDDYHHTTVEQDLIDPDDGECAHQDSYQQR